MGRVWPRAGNHIFYTYRVGDRTLTTDGLGKLLPALAIVGIVSKINFKIRGFLRIILDVQIRIPNSNFYATSLISNRRQIFSKYFKLQSTYLLYFNTLELSYLARRHRPLLLNQSTTQNHHHRRSAFLIRSTFNSTAQTTTASTLFPLISNKTFATTLAKTSSYLRPLLFSWRWMDRL